MYSEENNQPVMLQKKYAALFALRRFMLSSIQLNLTPAVLISLGLIVISLPRRHLRHRHTSPKPPQRGFCAPL